MNRRHEQAALLLKKARQDETVVNEVVDCPSVSNEIIGFHCQQAVEKLLKALLVECEVRFRKTHNLRQLMGLLADSQHPVPDDLGELDTLTPFAAFFRYDAEPAAVSLDRHKALDMVRRLREWVEAQLRQ